MPVLMDIEWFSNPRQFSPTQLCALRVSDDWERLDEFYTRIRPTNEEDFNAGEICFAGGKKSEFVTAPEVTEAIKAFAQWLQPDDTLLWWSETGASVLNRIWRYVFGCNMQSCGILQNLIRRHWPQGKKNAPKGLLAVARLTPDCACLPEHCSYCDTENLRRALVYVHISLEQYRKEACMVDPCRLTRKRVKGLPRVAWREPVYASRESRFPVIHDRQCLYLKRIPKERRVMFPNLQEAFRSGGRLCRHCLSVHRHYWNDRRNIDSFLGEQHFTCEMQDDGIRITSRKGSWYILIDEYTGRLALYHQNTLKQANPDEPARISGYHRQRLNPKDILECLHYIANHDRYRIKQDKKYAKQAKLRKLPPKPSKPIRVPGQEDKAASRRAKQKRAKLHLQAMWEDF